MFRANFADRTSGNSINASPIAIMNWPSERNRSLFPWFQSLDDLLAHPLGNQVPLPLFNSSLRTLTPTELECLQSDTHKNFIEYIVRHFSRGPGRPARGSETDELERNYRLAQLAWVKFYRQNMLPEEVQAFSAFIENVLRFDLRIERNVKYSVWGLAIKLGNLEIIIGNTVGLPSHQLETLNSHRNTMLCRDEYYLLRLACSHKDPSLQIFTALIQGLPESDRQAVLCHPVVLRAIMAEAGQPFLNALFSMPAIFCQSAALDVAIAQKSYAFSFVCACLTGNQDAAMFIAQRYPAELPIMLAAVKDKLWNIFDSGYLDLIDWLLTCSTINPTLRSEMIPRLNISEVTRRLLPQVPTWSSLVNPGRSHAYPHESDLLDRQTNWFLTTDTITYTEKLSLLLELDDRLAIPDFLPNKSNHQIWHVLLSRCSVDARFLGKIVNDFFRSTSDKRRFLLANHGALLNTACRTKNSVLIDTLFFNLKITCKTFDELWELITQNRILFKAIEIASDLQFWDFIRALFTLFESPFYIQEMAQVIIANGHIRWILESGLLTQDEFKELLLMNNAKLLRSLAKKFEYKPEFEFLRWVLDTDIFDHQQKTHLLFDEPTAEESVATTSNAFSYVVTPSVSVVRQLFDKMKHQYIPTKNVSEDDSKSYELSVKTSQAQRSIAPGMLDLERFDPEYQVGDCLFTAVRQFLDGFDTDLDLRQDLVNFMRTDPTSLANINMAMTNNQGSYRLNQGHHFETASTVNEYLDIMMRPQVWGDEPEIEALSRRFQRPIYVIRPGGNPTGIYGQAFTQEPIYLYYENLNHYVPLRLREGSTLTAQTITEAVRTYNDSNPEERAKIQYERARVQNTIVVTERKKLDSSFEALTTDVLRLFPEAASILRAQSANYSRVIQLLVDKALFSLQQRQWYFGMSFPDGIFDLAETEVEYYLTIMELMIQINTPHLNSALRDFVGLDSIRHALKRGDSAIVRNQAYFYQLARDVENNIALAVFASERKVKSSAIPKILVNDSLGHEEVVSNPENSMRKGDLLAPVDDEKSIFDILRERYSTSLESNGGVDPILDMLRYELAQNYLANPAKIHFFGQEYQLPLDYHEFNAFIVANREFNFEMRTLALHAYYRHYIHTAYRYLLEDNPWLASSASSGSRYRGRFFDDVSDNSSDDEQETTTNFESIIYQIAYVYLAAHDKSMFEPGVSIEDMKHFLFRTLAEICRAHNMDRSRQQKDAAGNLVRDDSGKIRMEHYDDLLPDKDSCVPGAITRVLRLPQHQIFKRLIPEQITAHFFEFIERLYRSKFEAYPDLNLLLADLDECSALIDVPYTSYPARVRAFDLTHEDSQAFVQHMAAQYPGQTNTRMFHFRVQMMFQLNASNPDRVPSLYLYYIQARIDQALVDMIRLRESGVVSVVSSAAATSQGMKK